MKTKIAFIAMGLAVLAMSTALAQEEEARPDGERRGGEMRERMIKEFDADGNGELSDKERQTARETMRERRGDKGPGERSRGGEGRRGREGRPVPPDPNKLFDEFDADKDGQLSRDEYMKLSQAQRDRRPPRPQREGRPGGPGPGGDDRPGPPPERRALDHEPPLQNQVRPPRGEGRRGSGGEGRGPEARGPEGRPGPDPNRMFDRFDENGDDQLSRDEFMKLSDTLRDMRERFGAGGQRGRGSRGEGAGPHNREGRPPRPKRPESDSDAANEAPSADENSA